MSATSGIGLLMAKIGAVALALGGVAWFTWNAHVNAQPPAPAPEEPQEEAIELSPEQLEELMLHSSKSLSPTDIEIKDVEELAEPAEEPKGFLGSSKSLPYEETFGDLTKAKRTNATRSKGATPKDDEPRMMPSSKSMPPGWVKKAKTK